MIDDNDGADGDDDEEQTSSEYIGLFSVIEAVRKAASEMDQLIVIPDLSGDDQDPDDHDRDLTLQVREVSDELTDRYAELLPDGLQAVARKKSPISKSLILANRCIAERRRLAAAIPALAEVFKISVPPAEIWIDLKERLERLLEEHYQRCIETVFESLVHEVRDNQ